MRNVSGSRAAGRADVFDMRSSGADGRCSAGRAPAAGPRAGGGGRAALGDGLAPCHDRGASGQASYGLVVVTGSSLVDACPASASGLSGAAAAGAALRAEQAARLEARLQRRRRASLAALGLTECGEGGAPKAVRPIAAPAKAVPAKAAPAPVPAPAPVAARAVPAVRSCTVTPSIAPCRHRRRRILAAALRPLR